MPTECVWRDIRPEYDDCAAGDCHFVDIEPYRTILSAHYLTNVAAERRPIMVWIQSRRPEWVFPFIIDSHPSSEPAAHWDVTVDLASLVDGRKPAITVTPSIAAETAWHGYLTDGVLGDDLG